jgi:hypothetical protein
MSPAPKRLALACALASMLILASCGHLTTLIGAGSRSSIDVNAVACEAFKPITWADGDTDDTLRQVHQHNAAWTELCGARRETTH